MGAKVIILAKSKFLKSLRHRALCKVCSILCAADTVCAAMLRCTDTALHSPQATEDSGLPSLYCFRHYMEGKPLSLVACAFILPVQCARTRRDREGCLPYVACWTKECNYDLGHSPCCYLHSAKCKTYPVPPLDYL